MISDSCFSPNGCGPNAECISGSEKLYQKSCACIPDYFDVNRGFSPLKCEKRAYNVLIIN